MTFTLTGTLDDHALQPIVGATLIITPTPSVTIDHDGDTIHLGGAAVTTDATGTFTVELAHAPDLFYTVRTTAGGRLRPVRFACADIADGVQVDLSDVTPAPAPSPMTEYVRGASAYELWLDAGNVGTEADFLASLAGTDGTDGLMSLTPTVTPGVLKIGVNQ